MIATVTTGMGGATLDGVVREGLLEKMDKQTPDVCVKLQRMSIAGRGTSKCKGSGVRSERKLAELEDSEQQGELCASWWVRWDHGRLWFSVRESH